MTVAPGLVFVDGLFHSQKPLPQVPAGGGARDLQEDSEEAAAHQLTTSPG
jgi:hypothetical protein